jgi:Cys-Gly metallodipeptidase DUG1
VYNQAPDYTREGGSIPVTLTFAEALGVNVLLLPMGRGDDGAQYVLISSYDSVTDFVLHSSTNEKLDTSNFIQGVSNAVIYSVRTFELMLDTQTKLLGSYLYEVSAEKKA